MQRVTLEISNLCDIWPIEVRKNGIALFTMMDARQIRRNIKTLKETQKIKPKNIAHGKD